jgi:hypothetical protein
MEENRKSLPPPWSPSSTRQPSRPAGPRQTAKPMRFDPSSPGLLPRLPDDGDGMDQARHTPGRNALQKTAHLRHYQAIMKGGKMHTDDPGKRTDNTLEDFKGAHIIAYNVSEEERPGGPDGLKVRWKWRIETGRRADVIDARQAEAIRKALQWLHTHPPQQ